MEQVTVDQLVEALAPELKEYKTMRQSNQVYIDAVSNQEFDKLVLDYYDHYRDFYTGLAEEIHFRQLDIDSEEYNAFYVNYVMMYYNFIDEVSLYISAINEQEDMDITFKDVIVKIDPADIFYAVQVNIDNIETKNYISDVSRLLIYQAIRKVEDELSDKGND